MEPLPDVLQQQQRWQKASDSFSAKQAPSFCLLFHGRLVPHQQAKADAL
jgi:hypothetical protein